MNRQFLGSGMKFPPQIDKSTGRFQVSSGAASVKEAIYLILMTNRGERWLEPCFGGGLIGYTFMDTSLTSLGLMSNDLRALLLEQEPRISEVRVDVNSELREGCLLVNIAYTLAEANTRDNLVFPFYLTAQSEEESNETAV